MEYRRLGKSGLPISEFSLGSWLTFGKQIGDTTAEDLMKTAYDAGVNFFDNAEIYARGESEKVMGSILKKMQWERDSYIVSSKVFFGVKGLKDSKPTQKGLHRKHIFEACHQALKRLQVEYLDLYFCHRPDKNTPIEETVWAMHNLITQGKILYWGTSEWTAEEINQAYEFAIENNLTPPTMEQPQYNLLDRQRFEVEYNPIFEKYNMGTTTWSPLASGALTGKYLEGVPDGSRASLKGYEWLRKHMIDSDRGQERMNRVSKYIEITKKYNLDPTKLAIAWCLLNKNVSTVILGASDMTQLENNLKSLDYLKNFDDADLTEALRKV